MPSNNEKKKNKSVESFAKILGQNLEERQEKIVFFFYPIGVYILLIFLRHCVNIFAREKKLFENNVEIGSNHVIMKIAPFRKCASIV